MKNKKINIDPETHQQLVIAIVTCLNINLELAQNCFEQILRQVLQKLAKDQKQLASLLRGKQEQADQASSTKSSSQQAGAKAAG